MSRGYSVVGLDNPKTPANIGSALRAAGCYGAASVVLGGKRPARLSKCPTDPQKQYRHIPSFIVDDVMDMVPYDCVPVAVDLVDGARSIVEYKHPERAFYVFGAEDSTLGARIIDRCRDVIYVPTANCMNLAATVNVVLYDRMIKGMK